MRRFNAAINDRDPDALAAVMSEDHSFVDTAGTVVTGRDACLDTWRGFFAAFPDYRNEFAEVVVRDDRVLVTGRSVCSEPALHGPALWTARTRGEVVTEWRVYEDTPGNRARLGLR
ncbi:MAG: DUF4440 domain-containing protein [Streptosporangiales bacterium]|nr:DUF4440 domain-containing protein [Streptosporangiales bacterium]